MANTRMALSIFGFVALSLMAPALHALDDNGAKQVIAKFISSQKNEQGDAQAGQHVIADVNGDGKPDIVLQWLVLGPTFGTYKMSIFLDQGKNYRTLTMDLPGDVQNVSVKGPVIIVDTLTPGPKDPRCCPSVKSQLRFRWAGGKLTREK